MKKFLLFLFIFQSLSGNTQDTYCGFEINPTGNPGLDSLYESMQELYSQDLQRVPPDVLITIPVVFHVMEWGSTPLLTDSEIVDALKLLNDNFSGFNDNDDDSVNTNIEFCLATRDPEGNSSNGIIRFDCNSGCGSYSENGLYFNVGGISSYVNGLSVWPIDYLNIWVVNEGIAFGSATPPNMADDTWDGVVITADHIESGVLTHEVGHFLDLLHTFESYEIQCDLYSQGLNVACCQLGDRVCDTAPHERSVLDESTGSFPCYQSTMINSCCTGEFGEPLCDYSGDFCGGDFSVGTDADTYNNNFMNYSSCISEFTHGQVDRMRDAIIMFRPELHNSLGCELPCTEIDDDIVGNFVLNAGDVSNYSVSGEYQSYEWFLDGNFVASDASTIITFNESGLYDVCVILNNGNCLRSYCIEIYVLNSPADCIDLSFPNCNFVLNSSFNLNSGVENYTSVPDPSLLCNWINRIGSPTICTQSGRVGLYCLNSFFLGQDVQGISTTHMLNLEDGKSYSLSLDFTTAISEIAGQNMNMGGFVIGLSDSFVSNGVQNDFIIHDEAIVQSNGVESISIPNAYVCDVVLDQKLENIEFEYDSDMMGNYLFIEVYFDDATQSTLIIDNVTVSPIDQPTINLLNIDNQCYLEDEEHDITVSVTDGSVPYTYEWINDAEPNMVLSTQESFDLNESMLTSQQVIDIQTEFISPSYTVIVSDKNGCTISATTNPFTLRSIPIVTISTVDSDCNNLGKICLDITDNEDRTAIEFSFDGGMTYEQKIPDNSGQVCYDLPDGSYDVWSRWGNDQCPVDLDEINDATINNDCILPLECTDNGDVISIGNAENEDIKTLSDLILENELSMPIVGQEFHVNGSIIFNVDAQFEDCKFYFKDGSRIEMLQNTISLDYCLLTACNDTWEGVELNGTSLNLENSTVSFAFIGIQANDDVYSNMTIDECNFIQNYTGISLNGNHEIYLDNSDFTGPELGTPANDWLTGQYYLPSGLRFNNTNVYQSTIGVNGPNTFESNLFYGVFANNSSFWIENTTFRNIGNNDEFEGVQINNNVFAPRSAIRSIGNSSYNYIRYCRIENCTRGFWMQNRSSSIYGSPNIDVFETGILASNITARNNTITSKYKGISANGVHCTISDNSIELENSTDFENGAGIHIYASEGGIINDGAEHGHSTVRIENNSIKASNTTWAGILSQNSETVQILENSVDIQNPINTTGILVSGKVDYEIECNNIFSDNSNGSSGVSNGIVIQMSGDHRLSNNILDNLTTGIRTRFNANDIDINCTQFQGGHTGLKVESFIGPQPNGVNAWADGAYQVDAESIFEFFENQQMQFTVADPDPMDDCPDQATHLFPCEIIGDEWFEYDPDGDVVCQANGCEGNIGYDGLTSPEDELELLCEWNEGRSDTLSCEEQWVQDYQLYSMIKGQGLDTLDDLREYDCLSQFLVDISDSPITTFYTIDSLLTVQDSLLVDSLITTSTALDNVMTNDDNRDLSLDSLQSQISDLLAQMDSLQQYNLVHVDSLLTQVGRDSCDIITDWEVVYDVLIDERSGEEITQRQIADLETIALKCPTHVGHVIYSARRIVSDRTHLRYDLIDDCGRVETRSRKQGTIVTSVGLSIVPNPSTDLVTIGLPEASNGTLTIQSLNGQVMYEHDTHGTESHKVMTTTYRSGIYIVSFDSINGEHYVSKLVIVK